MATEQNNTTPEQLAKQFPITAENLTAADLDAINNRLYRVVLSLLAIKELAISALSDSELAEHWIFSIEEMALSNIRGIDACIQRMGGFHLLQEIPEFKS